MYIGCRQTDDRSAGFVASSILPPYSGLISLRKQITEGAGSTDQQTVPGEVSWLVSEALGRHEVAATEAEGRPRRVDDLAVAVDAQKLEGGERRSSLSGFPVADRSEGHAQEVGSLLAIKARKNARVTKLLRSDRLASTCNLLFVKTL